MNATRGSAETAETVTVVATVTITRDELDQGWDGDIDEFAASIRATMHELVGDDGGAYVPGVVTYTAESERLAEVMEAYESWRETGTAALVALLTIWRTLEPDRKHMTFGDDPQRVVDETLRALREHRTDGGAAADEAEGVQ